jgi:hypothetical protein
MSSRETVSTRPLLDKLGVRPNARVHLVGDFGTDFRALLSQCTHEVHDGEPSATAPAGLVFLTADSHAELAPLSRLRHAIVPNGAVWVVSTKGKFATLGDVEVIEAALAAGLVDNKVVSFSDTQTALRLVIRLRDRPPGAPNAPRAPDTTTGGDAESV